MPPILLTLFAFLILLDLRIPFSPSTIFGLFSQTSILNSTTPLFTEFGPFCGDPIGVWSGSLLVRCCANSVLQLTGGRISGVWLSSDLAALSSVLLLLYFMSAVTVFSVSVLSVSGGSSAWDDWLSEIMVTSGIFSVCLSGIIGYVSELVDCFCSSDFTLLWVSHNSPLLNRPHLVHRLVGFLVSSFFFNGWIFKGLDASFLWMILPSLVVMVCLVSLAAVNILSVLNLHFSALGLFSFSKNW